MDEPVTIRRQGWYEFWFMFEGKVYIQTSIDGIEWFEPELTPYIHVPFIEMKNLTPF